MARLRPKAGFKPFALKPADKLLANARARERRKMRGSLPAFANEAEMREKVTLTEDEMKAWNQIASGRPMRNSTAVLQAIKMKMEFTMAKPAQKVDSDQKVHIEVLSLAPDESAPPPRRMSPHSPAMTS